MKRFSKIFVVVLAIALLVGVLALAISAEDPAPEAPAVEGNFVVQGKGYETWELAVEAAANTHTIYLNADWNLPTGLLLSGAGTNVKINLNGKSVGTLDGTKLFNVYQNAKLTIEGEGTLNNLGDVLIQGSSHGTVTINATGAGIVINNNSNNSSHSVNTLRFDTYSTLNLSGKIVLNTNGVTSSRTFINTHDSSKKTVNLNITDADLLFATPNVKGAPFGKMLYTGYSNVNIKNSKIVGVYTYTIYSATNATNEGGYFNIGSYLYDAGSADAHDYRWNPDTLATAKSSLGVTIAEHYNFSDSTICTQNGSVTIGEELVEYKSTTNGGLMQVSGAIEGTFSNCVFYGYGRAIHGAQANDSWSNIAKKWTDGSQLTFIDCHFRSSNSGTITYLMCYGPNFKIIGGSVGALNNGLSNCQPHYIELDNGQWIGGYVDNVLGLSGLKGASQVISTAWQNVTVANPNSVYTGTLPKGVTITLDGVATTFTTGYFSDLNKFNAYFEDTSSIIIAGTTTSSTGNFEGNEYYLIQDRVNKAGSPLGISFSSKLSTTVVTAGLNVEAKKEANGNGYVKFSYAYTGKDTTRYSEMYIGGNPSVKNNKPNAAQYNFTSYNYYIQEIDVATTTGKFLNWDMNFQGRAMYPYLDKDGNKIGVSGIYQPTVSGFFKITNNQLVVGSDKADLKADGSWNRITFVTEAFVGDAIPATSVEGLKIPAYESYLDGTTTKYRVITDEYLTAEAMATLKVRKIDVYHYIYLNGEYVGTIHSWGSDSYKNSGCYSGYALVEADGSDWAITHSSYSMRGTAAQVLLDTEADICFDNTRSSVYTKGTDIGLYENGEIIKTLPVNEYYQVMPNNNIYATVDGVNYYSESEAIAAIEEGSTLKLFKDFKSYLPSYINEEKGNVSYYVIPNGCSFPGFVSETHMVVDYVAGLGYYKLVKAPDSEIFTINYTFGTKTVSTKFAYGTVVPAMTESFPSIIEGNKATSLTGWTIPEEYSNYALESNVIEAVPTTKDIDIVAVAGDVAFGTLEEAIAGANGKTIVLVDNVTVDSQIYVDKLNVTLNLNGKTITASDNATNIFNVRFGSVFTLEGAGVIENVSSFMAASDLGAATHSTVNINADAASTGIVINHRTVDGGADSNTQLNAFRFHDGSILNVSGLLTVNAYNGQRVVFNVVAGSGTTAATSLNISRAKIYVPILGRSAEGVAQPKGFSQVINVADGTTVNINDSEIKAIYGQLFRVTGSNNTSVISSYRNEDFTWKENAASSITLSAPSCYIYVSNSTLYSEWGGFGTEKFSASGRNPGVSIMDLKADAYVHFDKTNIYFDFRGINVTDATGEGTKVNHSQILFTDCNIMDAPSTNNDAPFMLYGPNFKMIGGTWASSNWISNGSHNHLDLDNGRWIGSYLDGVLFTSKLSFATKPARWGDNTTTEPYSYHTCNVTKIIDGKTYTFKHAYYSDLDAFEEVVGMLAYAGYYNTGVHDTFGNFSGSALGTITKTDGYVKHYFSGAMSKDTYSHFDANNIAEWNYANLSSYVWEFDVSTDTNYFAPTSFGVEGREKHPAFDENGNLIGYIGSSNNIGGTRYTAGGSFEILDNYVKMNGKKAYISTEAGEWTRISVVVNIVLGEEKTIQAPVYVKDGSNVVEVEGKTMDLQVVDIMDSTVSVYVNGVLLETVPFFRDTWFYNGYIAKDYIKDGYIDDLRFRNYPEKECSILYDNIIFMPVFKNSGVDLGFDKDGNAPATLDGNKYFGILDRIDEYFTPVINVDGVDFDNVKDASAAIKEGSFVELLADVNEPIEINYNNVKLKSNGYSYPGFASSTYTVLDYSAARGAIYSTPAAAEDIVTITFPAYGGVAETQQNAVIGSCLKAPAVYDSVARLLDKALKQYNILSWSLSEDGDVVIVTESAAAYAKLTPVDAIVINWTDESGLIVLDTDYYFPGESTVLDEFDGTDVEVDTTPDYYSYGRIAWDKDAVKAATAALAGEGGEYDIPAVMGKMAPDTFPGLMYNLSLYSNFVMNLYIPVELEGVTNLTVSTLVDGSVSLEKFEDGTLYGKAYQKYGYMYGVADTEMHTFYIVYNVGEDVIAFPVTVGVPQYAEIVMGEDYEADEATKNLITNMANYASKLLVINGVDMNSYGAQVYANIVANNSEYLAKYNSLTNEMFMKDGELYKKYGVDSLNWVTKTDEKEENVTAISYIKSITFVFDSFEPGYRIEYSDAAVAKGIQRPYSDGSTGYYGYGLHTYIGWTTPLATTTWAQKPGNDKKLYSASSIWATMDGSGNVTNNCNAVEYDYFAQSHNGGWSATGKDAGRQQWFKVQHITNNVTIKFYWGENNSDNPLGLGEVKYNLAAYVNSLLDENGNAKEGSEAYIDAVKALYAYAYASAAYN